MTPPRIPSLLAVCLGLAFLCSPVISAAAAATAALADKPFMGWSSWGFFHAKPGIRAEIDAMDEKLKPFGYTYINMADGWSDGFDEYGRPRPDPAKFPGGIAALADYVHSRGLKLGISLNPGMPKAVWDANSPIYGVPLHARDISLASENGNTLGKADRIDYTRRGAAEYIQSCADLAASWGIDFIRLENVGPGDGRVPADNRTDVQHWSAALKKTGRPIWLELSESLDLRYIDIWKKYAQSWRIEADIEPANIAHPLTNWTRVSRRFQHAPRWAPYAGPGGWNDFDSLEIGNGASTGLTPDERRTVMTFWCVSCSPLAVGADLTELDKGDLALLTNPEVIAVDQAGRVATPTSLGSAQQVWRVHNPDGSFTVALFNLDSVPAIVTAYWNELSFHGPASVRDLWSHSDLGVFAKGFSVPLNAHASRLLKVTP